LIRDDVPLIENGTTTNKSTIDETTDGEVSLSPPSLSTGGVGTAYDFTYGRNANYASRNFRRSSNGFGENSHANDDLAFMPVGSSEGFYGEGDNKKETQIKFGSRLQFDKYARRTVRSFDSFNFLLYVPAHIFSHSCGPATAHTDVLLFYSTRNSPRGIY
jgi:hypothetical protein